MKNFRKISILTAIVAMITTGLIGYYYGLKGYDHVGHVNPLPEMFIISTKLEPFYNKVHPSNPGRIFFIENTRTKTRYSIHIDLITGDMHESMQNDQLPEDFFYFSLATEREARPGKKNRSMYQVTGFSMGCLSGDGETLDLKDDMVNNAFELFCPTGNVFHIERVRELLKK